MRRLPFFTRPALILLVATCATSSTFAQLLTKNVGSIFYPCGLPRGEFKDAIGITLSKPPEEVVEEFSDVLHAPLVEYIIQYGMSDDFLLELRATTIIVSNHIAVGTKWTLKSTPFATAIGSDVAYWFGSLQIEGFDNSVGGWSMYPHVALGWDCGKFKLTMRIELNLLLRQMKRTGEITVQHAANIFNGGSIIFYLEQPLWKDNYVALAFKCNFMRYYYVVWPGFPTFDRYSYIPEFYVGIVL